jgi:Fe-S cluster assembly ATP-binding protein
MLEIKDLKVSIEDKEILSGINLKVKAGEVHAIMGPNGSGKSTLASALAGRDYFDITQGKILYEGQDLTELSPEDRAREGIFLGFQYPVEIPGVSMVNFLRTALNSLREYRNQEPLPAGDFLKLMREKKNLVEIDSDLTNRSVNEGFSGGEKRRTRSSRWRSWNPGWPSWMKPIPGWILMRSVLYLTA